MGPGKLKHAPQREDQGGVEQGEAEDELVSDLVRDVGEGAEHDEKRSGGQAVARGALDRTCPAADGRRDVDRSFRRMSTTMTASTASAIIVGTGIVTFARPILQTRSAIWAGAYASVVEPTEGSGPEARGDGLPV